MIEPTIVNIESVTGLLYYRVIRDQLRGHRFAYYQRSKSQFLHCDSGRHRSLLIYVIDPWLTEELQQSVTNIDNWAGFYSRQIQADLLQISGDGSLDIDQLPLPDRYGHITMLAPKRTDLVTARRIDKIIDYEWDQPNPAPDQLPGLRQQIEAELGWGFVKNADTDVVMITDRSDISVRHLRQRHHTEFYTTSGPSLITQDLWNLNLLLFLDQI